MYFQEKNPDDTLRIQNLHIVFRTHGKEKEAVKGIDLTLKAGCITALVGESGSGKSVTAMAVMNLLAWNGKVTEGQVLLGETDLLKLSKKERHRLNGSVFGMIFQDPTSSLDPLFTIGDQIIEGMIRHRRISRREAEQEAQGALASLRLQDVDYLMKCRPHELSGGMCQRVMIATAMALNPRFLMADEPTTALDVTVQAQILRQLHRLCREKNVGILFITHDLGVVAQIADEVSIMKDGRIVEQGGVKQIFHSPENEYTKRLLMSAL